MNSPVMLEHWYAGVKKIYVIESVDYYTRKGSTTIIICYKSWWKMRRKLKFARTRTGHNDAEMYEQVPQAKAIIARLKGKLKPGRKKTLFDEESPIAALRSVLPSFTDMPRFSGWPTAK
jgi:hypothetical protein